jgi:phosphoserine aminotransferase
VNTGAWSKKAIAEAKRYCKVNVVPTPRDRLHEVPPQRVAAFARRGLPALHAERDDRRRRIPRFPDAARAARRGHVIDDPVAAARRQPLRRDLRRRAEEHRPGGLVVVIVRDDLLGRARADTPTVFDWKAMAADGSMLNTPATYSWYVAGSSSSGSSARAARGNGDAEPAKAASCTRDRRSGFYRNPVAVDAARG